MIPGIGEMNARRQLRASLRRRREALDRAYQYLVKAQNACWTSRRAAAEIASVSSAGARESLPKLLLKALAEEEQIPGDREIYRALVDARELEGLLAGKP